MGNNSLGLRWKVLAIRVVLGLLFALLLLRFFFPGSGFPTILATAGMLVFFAYVFEWIHGNKER